MSVKDLKKFQERFEKRFGEGTLPESKITPYSVIPTGSLELDYALGVGGWMRGRQHEVWGPEGVGKSTLALLSAAEAQRAEPDLTVGWIDMENALDFSWAARHGVDLDRLQVYRPLTAEDVADALKDFVQSDLFSFIVVDSIGAMISKIEREKDADEETIARVAKIVTRMVKINGPEAVHTEAQPVLFYINQVRANIAYGADTISTGGFALKHATTTKVKLGYSFDRKFETTVDGQKVPVGHEITAKVERNRVAPKGLVAKAVLLARDSKFGEVGIDKADEAFRLGKRTKIIEQAGAYYTLPGGLKVQGEEKALSALRSDPEILKAVRDLVLVQAAQNVYEQEQDESDEG